MERETKSSWKKFEKISLIIVTIGAGIGIISYFKPLDAGIQDPPKPAMSESAYISALCEAINEKMLFHYYCDYDGDGLYEMFALVESESKEESENPDRCGKVWYVNQDGVKEIEKRQMDYYSPFVFTLRGKTFIAFTNGWSTGSLVYIWGVINGEPYQPVISGKASDININEFNEIELMHSTYDMALEKEMDNEFKHYSDVYGRPEPIMLGHTWKKYYFYFDGNAFKEYGGKNITIEDIMKISKGKAIVNEIYNNSYNIDSIYYRENGLIHINISKESDDEIRYMNITLRFIDGEWEYVVTGIFENEYSEGIYLDAMIPTIATYPDQFQINQLFKNH